MSKENREHKDSVFVDLFYNDETADINLLSLYNALHDTELEDAGLIRKIKVEDVLYMNFRNDLLYPYWYWNDCYRKFLVFLHKIGKINQRTKKIIHK